MSLSGQPLDAECQMNQPFPTVSDSIFEVVLDDMQRHPMSSMKATAARTGLSYGSVWKAVRYMTLEGTVVRRRIGAGAPAGIASTYANLVLPSRF